MPSRTLLVPLLVIPAILAAVVWAARSPVTLNESAAAPPRQDEIVAAALRIDVELQKQWSALGILPSVPADDLQILRRLTLALAGTIPSLEDIRQFELDRSPDRLLRWAAKLLDDQRFADYFSERLARGYVGVDTAPFLIFRRDRFKDWLSRELKANAAYDVLVRRIIADDGLWTGSPATNFVTSAVVDDNVDENKLAGRSVRVFLGQRMDCAQCHDHPYARWKQHEYEGVAAFFGQVQVGVGGVEDLTMRGGKPLEYSVEDRQTLKSREAPPRVPFHPEWMPAEGSRRQRLAAWITHPQNRRFDRAIVNRVWAYLFGRPCHDPVDDLPDPPDAGDETVLDLLASDFAANGRDLKRLILTISATRAFRISSASDVDDPNALEAARKHWAIFPMTRLRPEQVIGSMLQASSLQTIDQNSHLVTRVARFFREKNFVDEYGDLGEAELADQVSTIPQALQRMNSQLSREIVQANPLNATGRIANISPTADACLENCYLVALSRRPTPEESAALAAQLAPQAESPRQRAVEDLLWAMFNSEEFSWNH